jgi:hypothetical protein
MAQAYVRKLLNNPTIASQVFTLHSIIIEKCGDLVTLKPVRRSCAENMAMGTAPLNPAVVVKKRVFFDAKVESSHQKPEN